MGHPKVLASIDMPPVLFLVNSDETEGFAFSHKDATKLRDHYNKDSACEAMKPLDGFKLKKKKATYTLDGYPETTTTFVTVKIENDEVWNELHNMKVLEKVMKRSFTKEKKEIKSLMRVARMSHETKEAL